MDTNVVVVGVILLVVLALVALLYLYPAMFGMESIPRSIPAPGGVTRGVTGGVTGGGAHPYRPIRQPSGATGLTMAQLRDRSGGALVVHAHDARDMSKNLEYMVVVVVADFCGHCRRLMGTLYKAWQDQPASVRGIAVTSLSGTAPEERTFWTGPGVVPVNYVLVKGVIAGEPRPGALPSIAAMREWAQGVARNHTPAPVAAPTAPAPSSAPPAPVAVPAPIAAPNAAPPAPRSPSETGEAESTRGTPAPGSTSPPRVVASPVAVPVPPPGPAAQNPPPRVLVEEVVEDAVNDVEEQEGRAAAESTPGDAGTGTNADGEASL